MSVPTRRPLLVLPSISLTIGVEIGVIHDSYKCGPTFPILSTQHDQVIQVFNHDGFPPRFFLPAPLPVSGPASQPPPGTTGSDSGTASSAASQSMRLRLASDSTSAEDRWPPAKLTKTRAAGTNPRSSRLAVPSRGRSLRGGAAKSEKTRPGRTAAATIA